MSSTYVEAAEVNAPAWPDAIDPAGKHFALSVEGKGALAVFALAATWQL